MWFFVILLRIIGKDCLLILRLLLFELLHQKAEQLILGVSFYSFLGNEYMITVANLVGNSGKIANAKPYLAPKITEELLKVQNLSITPHLTEECKRVIAQHAIGSFDEFFDKIDKQQEQVLEFVKSCRNSSRKKLRTKAEKFLEKWDN